MKEIKLSQNKVALVDDCDFEAVDRFCWSAQWAYNGNFYASTRIPKTKLKMTMHVFLLGNRIDERKYIIDHIDGNGLNNVRSNLRFCTRAQNRVNSKIVRMTDSIYRGVSWNESMNKWTAFIGIDYKTKYLGHFNNEISAALAYDKAAKNYHGEFAYLNFGSKQ
jgi:hypothetical protein